MSDHAIQATITVGFFVGVWLIMRWGTRNAPPRTIPPSPAAVRAASAPVEPSASLRAPVAVLVPPVATQRPVSGSRRRVVDFNPPMPRPVADERQLPQVYRKERQEMTRAMEELKTKIIGLEAELDRRRREPLTVDELEVLLDKFVRDTASTPEGREFLLSAIVAGEGDAG